MALLPPHLDTGHRRSVQPNRTSAVSKRTGCGHSRRSSRGYPRAVSNAGLSVDDLARGFEGVGIRPGQTVLVHSALRTLGPVSGGADTVVDALLRVLGPR